MRHNKKCHKHVFISSWLWMAVVWLGWGLHKVRMCRIHVFIKVVHSSHFLAIFTSFSLFIFLPFFKNELKNEHENELKMDHTPPILQKFSFSLSFCLHFHIPFLSFFQTPLQCLILSSDHHYQQQCPPPSHLYHYNNSITTCHHHFHTHSHIN